MINCVVDFQNTSVGNLYVFFWEILFRSFAYFKIIIRFVFCYLYSLKFLCILDINFLSDV